MENHWLTEAVSNNAAWCDAMAASHGSITHCDEVVWSCKSPMPRYYPNIVTLKRGFLIDETIDALISHLPLGWGVKDSYSELNLEGRGFRLAFEARWYCCPPSQYLTNEKNQKIQVKTVENQAEFCRWVAAWGDEDEVFNFSLLKNGSIELFYVEHGGEVVSGLATNQSNLSVGISNSFGSDDNLLGCIAAVVEKHPLKGIVGYGEKTEIATLSQVGFEEIGELRVWLRR